MAVPHVPMREDRELVAAVIAGNEAAFASLHDQYGRRIYGLAYRMTCSVADAEEIKQETFHRFLRSARYYDPAKSLRCLLLTIALKVSCDHLRKNRYKPDKVAASMREVSTVQQPVALSGMINADRDRAVANAMLCLPEMQRIAIILKYWEDYRIKDIAVILGENANNAVSENTVKSWLRRAEERLRRELSEWM